MLPNLDQKAKNMLGRLLRLMFVVGTVGLAGSFAGATSVTSQNLLAENQTNPSTSSRILQINFKYNNSTSDFRKQMKDVAPRIAKAPGLRWKIWSIDEGNKEASGFYLFEDEKSLNNYVENIFNVGMRNNSAISNIVVKKFNILEDPTIVTRGPISQLK